MLHVSPTRFYSTITFKEPPAPLLSAKTVIQFSRKLRVENGTREISLNFAIVPLDSSCLVWSGVSPANAFDNLVVAMVGGKAGPVATSVVGGSDDHASALRLAKRTNRVVHFATGLGMEAGNPEVRMFVEKTLVEAVLAL